jgi:hypothetical protein
MSFYYQYPQPKRYRGRLAKEYYWKMLDMKLRKLVIVSSIFGCVFYMAWNTKPAFRIRYMLKTGNTNMQIFKASDFK